MTRFLVVGDLHGQIPRIHFKEFDAIIAPGDLCSDRGVRAAYQKFYAEYLKNRKTRREWFDFVGKRKAKALVRQSLKDGERVLNVLDSFGKPVFLVPGNWDWPKVASSSWPYLREDHFSALVKQKRNVINMHGRRRTFGGVDVIGYGYVNGPELLRFRSYDGVSKEELARNEQKYHRLLEKYRRLFSGAKRPVLFLSHNVPFKSGLDKILDDHSLRFGFHYGSNLARDLLDEFNPLLCVGGHMHEHFGRRKVGKTTVINAGFGSRVNTLVEIVNGRLRKVSFFPKPYGNGRG
ncbi:hypothetical protein D6783_05435 [Candidatus Woesearchaeota archaeon]|nr:MAG: hypothetical protein D6783_05435 [Candidatus Woesearchaeota archaeon]